MSTDRDGPSSDGSEDSTELESQAAARQFVAHSLGMHSSHPETSPQRLYFWRWMALVAGLSVIAYAAFAVYTAFSWELSPLGGVLSGLRRAMRSTNVILLVMSLSLSATLAAALTIRISMLGSRTAQKPFSGAMFGWSAGMLSCLLVAVCVLFGWMIATNSVAVVAGNRWIVAVLAAVPLEALLLYAEVRERSRDQTVLGWTRTVLRQLWFAVSVSAIVMTMTPSFSRSVGSVIGGVLQGSSGPVGSVLSIVPGADAIMGIGSKMIQKGIGGFISSVVGLGIAMIVVVWVTTKVSSIATIPPHGRRVAEQRPGRLRRALSMLNPLNWFRSEEAEEEEHGARADRSTAPGWAHTVKPALSTLVSGHVDVVCRAPVDPAGLAGSPDYSPAAASSGLEFLFGGRVPTVDQLEALQSFDDLWIAHTKALHDTDFGPSRHSHADLLIQAFPESFADPEDHGVLEVQVAAAILAVIGRGQRVLFLVSDDSERAHVTSTLQSRLEALRVETLYRIGSLMPTDVAQWAPPAAAPGTVMEERPPDVMVGTLADYEQGFFGGASASHVVRAVLFDTEVVIIPNLLALTRSQEGRLHLPFVLDKHRLILASENRMMQLVAGTPPIGERPVAGRDSVSPASDAATAETHVAIESIALRIFGGDGSLAGHSRVLRRRIGSFPAHVIIRVQTAELGAVIDGVACHIASSEAVGDVCVVLGREDPRPDASRVQSLAVEGGGLAVLHELDFPDVAALADRARPFRFVVVQGRAGGRMVRELGGRLDRGTSTIVEVTSLRPSPQFSSPTWALTLPVFPSADSPALALAHLRSAAYQLGADSCLRRDEFVRFGIGWNRTRWLAGGEFQTLHEGWAIELDGRAESGFSGSRHQGEIWPAAIVRSDVRKERPVSLRVPPERGLALAGTDVLRMAEDGAVPDRGRGACWVGPRGQMLGTMDLAYANRLVYRGDRHDYRAVSVERTEEHGLLIHSQPMHGHGDEPELPAIEVAVHVPASSVSTALQVREGEHVRIYSVRDGGAEGRVSSLERISGLVSRNHRGGLRRGALLAGEATPIGPIEFRLRVGMSFLCLGTEEWLEGLDSFGGPACGSGPSPGWMHGDWCVAREMPGTRVFSPAFTVAIQRSLQAISPGVLEFSRIAAFRTESKGLGVVIAFIEPHATVGTVAEVMRTVIGDPALRRRFIGRMLESIASDGDDELPEMPMFLVDMDEALLAADRDWAQRLITLIPGSLVDVGGPIGTISRDSEALLAERPSFRPVSAHLGSTEPSMSRRWEWNTSDGSVKLGIEVGVSEAMATAATMSYGCEPHETDPDRLRRCGVRMFEGNRIGPDYSWMLRQSVEALKPLSARLLELASQVGAVTARDRVELFASFVQSMRYVRSAEGRVSDGKVRMGVQMPLETLFVGRGDCDSLSLLLLGLVRAANVATGCMVLVDEIDGGHALAAFEVDARSKRDWVVRARARGVDGVRTFTVIETTASNWRLGVVAPEYQGRYVRLDAVG